MKTRVIREDAVLGGEGSGHVFFRDLEGGDDGLYAALRMLDLLARAGVSFSALARSVPRYWLTRDIRVPFEGDATRLMDALARAAEAHARLDFTDGVKAYYPDGWALARASVTEPAITMRFEGRSQASLRAIITQFLAPSPQLLAEAMSAASEVPQ